MIKTTFTLLINFNRWYTQIIRLLKGESFKFYDRVYWSSKRENHCFRGDVYFSQRFYGDEFNVYRALRSINPSPYLFFFDYGSFKIFGSSPEAQIIIENGNAEIHPIAGTFKRTGNDTKDRELAKKLEKDPKENSEHVMLVDLARNDLSRNGSEVKVEKNRQIQFFSHVIHLVSKVGKCPLTTFSKYKISCSQVHHTMALNLLISRKYFKKFLWMVRYFDFEGNFNHCIIRSWAKISYQAVKLVSAVPRVERSRNGWGNNMKKYLWLIIMTLSLTI